MIAVLQSAYVVIVSGPDALQPVPHERRIWVIYLAQTVRRLLVLTYRPQRPVQVVRVRILPIHYFLYIPHMLTFNWFRLNLYSYSDINDCFFL